MIEIRMSWTRLSDTFTTTELETRQSTFTVHNLSEQQAEILQQIAQDIYKEGYNAGSNDKHQSLLRLLQSPNR